MGLGRRQMKTRHVLAVDPQGHLINQSLQITAYDQAFHRVESVVAAKKALSKYYCSVGLVVFDSLTPAFQDDIELLIAASPHDRVDCTCFAKNTGGEGISVIRIERLS